MTQPIPQDQWEWFGYPGHLICADRCRFRMCTVVGNHMISTVGDMRLEKDGSMEALGAGEDSFFETYVFSDIKRCDAAGCTCGGQPVLTKACEIDGERNATAEEARKSHYRYCHKYAGEQT